MTFQSHSLNTPKRNANPVKDLRGRNISAGTFWSFDEDYELIRGVAEGLHNEFTARRLPKRSTSAASARLLKLGFTQKDIKDRTKRGELIENLVNEGREYWLKNKKKRNKSILTDNASRPRWTKEEDIRLLVDTSSGMTPEGVASNVSTITKSTKGRSPNAMICRLTTLGLKVDELRQRTLSVEEAITILNNTNFYNKFNSGSLPRPRVAMVDSTTDKKKDREYDDLASKKNTKTAQEIEPLQILVTPDVPRDIYDTKNDKYVRLSDLDFSILGAIAEKWKKALMLAAVAQQEEEIRIYDKKE